MVFHGERAAQFDARDEGEVPQRRRRGGELGVAAAQSAEARSARQFLLGLQRRDGRFLDLLAEIDGKVSTEALARRAVFDLDGDNRQAAVAAALARARARRANATVAKK